MYLVEALVKGVSKGVGLQGDMPENGLVDDLQEGDVDEGGDHEDKGEVINFRFSRRWHVLVGDEHGQEEGEGAEHADEKDYEEDDEDEKLPEVGEEDQAEPFVEPHLAISL